MTRDENRTFRLIALDVDGTLLNDRYEITPRTRDAILQVREGGAAVVLCTGRSPSNTLPLLEELGLDGILITHNGAATVRSTDRALLHQFPFEAEQLRPLVEYCRERGIHRDVCTPFDLYVEETPQEAAMDMYRKFNIRPKHVPEMTALGENPVKFTVFGSADRMDDVERDWQTINMPLSVIRSGEYFIDVMHPEATKGNALRRLAESLGIDRSEVLAIGNYFNDLDMIRFSGLGIAMDNSPEAVKQAADEVTESNNDEGVRLALERHCLRH